MRIAEIFRSFQGEGRLTGTESIFVRTSGCNLRCRYCDTPYASWTPEGEDLSAREILARVERLAEEPWSTSCLPEDRSTPEGGSPIFVGRKSGQSPAYQGHIVVTGGEPMLFADVVSLCAAFHAQAMHITIETAGTLYQPVECDLMSISPKLSNSSPLSEEDPRGICRHEQGRHAPGVIRRLATQYDCQFKFVVDCPADCQEVEEYLAELPEIGRDRVMLMPQGTDAAELAEKARWLAPYCAEHGLSFCPRRQIEWFGSQRGT
jgi:7-carboxy-7-deazaguanine synthase